MGNAGGVGQLKTHNNAVENLTEEEHFRDSTVNVRILKLSPT
jgi:hypothetical protein